MILYKIGKVASLGKNYIIFESNYQGEILYVTNVKFFKKNDIRKIFFYIFKSEYYESIYGFLTFQERMIFENLLKIPGIGPKTSLNLLMHGADNFISLILHNNVLALTKYNNVQEKHAQQIILQFKNFNFIEKNKKKIAPIEVIDSLKTLGFDQKQIDFAVNKLGHSDSIETLVEEAIKIISNAKFT